MEFSMVKGKEGRKKKEKRRGEKRRTVVHHSRVRYLVSFVVGVYHTIYD